MIRILPPWFENISKRQTKAPKIYIRDSGLMNSLSRIEREEDVLTHPLKGAIWEGFALEEVIRHLNLAPEESFFWRTQNGAEIDLLVFKNGKRYGFEFKFGDAPKTTKSIRVACHDLRLDHAYIIYPGQRTIPLDENITGVGLTSFIRGIECEPFRQTEDGAV